MDIFQSLSKFENPQGTFFFNFSSLKKQITFSSFNFCSGAEIFSVDHVNKVPSLNLENGYVSASELKLKKAEGIRLCGSHRGGGSEE